MEESVEECEFEFALRRDVREESGLHGVERLAVRFGDDEVGGGESMFAGVECGPRFALFGARAGGKLRVGAISFELDLRWHVRISFVGGFLPHADCAAAVRGWRGGASGKWLGFVGEEKFWRVVNRLPANRLIRG